MGGHQPATDPAEGALIEAMVGYLDGRLECFDALYGALAARLRAYLRSLCRDEAVADDLLQETFLQMHRSRRTYQPPRPVTPWAFAIARHVFLMHRRSASRYAKRSAEAAAEYVRQYGDGVAPHAVDRGADLRAALEGIPVDQRAPVVLHHVHGWSFAEVAERLGIRVNAARTRAFRGLKKLREQLTGRES
jgi:RNA polymerase sigma-70 factor (ECF subfamily)